MAELSRNVTITLWRDHNTKSTIIQTERQLVGGLLAFLCFYDTTSQDYSILQTHHSFEFLTGVQGVLRNKTYFFHLTYHSRVLRTKRKLSVKGRQRQPNFTDRRSWPRCQQCRKTSSNQTRCCMTTCLRAGCRERVSQLLRGKEDHYKKTKQNMDFLAWDLNQIDLSDSHLGYVFFL